MKLHQLEIFECVTRHQSVTKAAHELHMSQPAVSLQLKLLEEECGRQLYCRTRYGIAMTDEGRAFLSAVRPILAQMEKLEIEFTAKTRPSRSESLSIAANNTLSSTIVPRAVSEFSECYPNVRFVLDIAHSDQIEKRILGSEVEVGLITRPNNWGQIFYEPYEEHETVAFVPKNSRLHKGTMSLADLTSHPLVVKKDCPSVQELESRGFDVMISLQCNARESVKMAVKKGLGIGLLFDVPMESDLELDDMRIINVPELREIRHRSYIIYPRGAKLSPNARNFVATLRQMKSRPVPIPGESRDEASGLAAAEIP
jgi:DNA-binding transcriptional LysR family regulator